MKVRVMKKLAEYWHGYDDGYEEGITKVCAWLEEHLIDYWSQKVTDPTEFINELKKAMEE